MVPQVLAANSSQSSALENGLEWVVIRKEVERAVPGLPNMLSECGNAGHATERLQTRLQTLLQIFNMGQRNMEAKGDYDWPLVAAHIERRHSHLRMQVLDMTTFVERWSGGGTRGVFLVELDLWSKQLKCRCEVDGKNIQNFGIDRL